MEGPVAILNFQCSVIFLIVAKEVCLSWYRWCQKFNHTEVMWQNWARQNWARLFEPLFPHLSEDEGRSDIYKAPSMEPGIK